MEELSKFIDEDERLDRLVELNVKEQCLNLFRNPIVQHKQASDNGYPRIHGMIYDIRDGLLCELKVDFETELQKNKGIYTIVKPTV